MTIVIPPQPSKAPAKRGNGKTLKEIAERETKSLARIEMERNLATARDMAADATKIADLKRQQKEQVFTRYDKQERKRVEPFQIDQLVTLVILSVLTAMTFIVTGVLTADGTIGASTAARFALPWFGYLLFGAFEIGTLAFMLMYYVNGSRIDYEGKRVPANRWFVAMVATSALTAMLSVYHVLDVYQYAWLDISMWVGIAIRLALAVLFVVVSKGVANVLFGRPVVFE
jgi:hypothetical protein